MKKYLFIISLLIFQVCFAAGSTEYNSVYKGVKVGESSIDSMIKILGKPLKITTYNSNIHYHFNGLKVTALATTGKVHTIAIRDINYTDINGIKVGFSKYKLEAALGTNTSDNYLVDREAGIVYWLKKNRVERIVLAHTL